ncbi:MAG TPA: hypothetical protein PKC38_07060 [Chitinophagales bacterium]|nr:hypothetical protein [Chitinophagales bacterium]
METTLAIKNQTELAKQTWTSCEGLWTEISKVDISGSSTSVMEIRNMGGRPISSLVRKNGSAVSDKSECYRFIQMCLIWICEFFGVAWTDTQVKESSKQLYSNYYFWTPYDWKHFMSRVVSGYFGKMYGAFTPAMLMEYAASHGKEWFEHSEQITVHDLDVLKRQEQDVADFQRMAEKQRDDRIHKSEVEAFKNKIQNKTT